MFDPPIEQTERPTRRIVIPVPAAFCILAVAMVVTILIWAAALS